MATTTPSSTTSTAVDSGPLDIAALADPATTRKRAVTRLRSFRGSIAHAGVKFGLGDNRALTVFLGGGSGVDAGTVLTSSRVDAVIGESLGHQAGIFESALAMISICADVDRGR